MKHGSSFNAPWHVIHLFLLVITAEVIQSSPCYSLSPGADSLKDDTFSLPYRSSLMSLTLQHQQQHHNWAVKGHQQEGFSTYLPAVYLQSLFIRRPFIWALSTAGRVDSGVQHRDLGPGVSGPHCVVFMLDSEWKYILQSTFLTQTNMSSSLLQYQLLNIR